MRPLPRVLALTDDRVRALDDFGVRCAAIAAAGPSVGVVARAPGGTTDELEQLALRIAALARPPMAWTAVTGRVDVALAAGLDGVILRTNDITPADARAAVAAARGDARPLAVLRSVHSVDEAGAAVAGGADGLLVGTIWPTASHPGRAAAGLALVAATAALGVPVWAIGGVTAPRAADARRAGAWGVAAIGAAWDADDPHRAVLALLEPWLGMED